MALIEYEITYVKGKKPTVTSKVVEVDKGDRIRFKSNAPAGIKYRKRSPFQDPKAPQPNQVFPVNSQTAAFEVAKTIRRPIHFDCGPAPDSVTPPKQVAKASTKPIRQPRGIAKPWGTGSDDRGWKPWGTGGDTPPGK